ncbi:4389_t:CDS:1, partial [Racocetra fulgida]
MSGKLDLQKVTTYDFVQPSQDILIEIRNITQTTQATNNVYQDLHNVLEVIKTLQRKIEDLDK